MEKVKDFFGMNVMRNRAAKTLTLSDPGHTATLLDAVEMDKATPNRTPLTSGVKLTKTGASLLPKGNRYAELVGSLLYLTTTTRPYLGFFCEGSVALHVMLWGGPHARGQGGFALPARNDSPGGGLRR